ncbi:hypothetical protein [Megamonas funiformis]|uniref:hypothetical protein n=1 Tax=Megamonas funiformis TaxID=437897 RepID=UPI0022E5CB1D|nr:hypothetical protein [Megamonas funiformis]
MYKNFFISILFVVFIISTSQVLIAYSLSNNNVWNNVFPNIILDKHKQISKNIKQPKILIISGSNSFFGINTELMSKELNYVIINHGSGVSLNLDYILNESKNCINDNDIVILPLEYVLYCDNKFSENRIIQIWQNDKQYFDNMPFLDRIQLLYSISLDLEKKVIGTYIGKPIKNELPIEYMSTNKSGDSINNTKTKEDAVNIKNPFDKNKIYLDENTRQTIMDFLNYCKSKNVKVFVTYPSYYYNQSYFDGYNLEQIDKINQFWKEQNIIVLGQYTDFIYINKSDFYDSEYHLNIKGREKRTEKLIELLKPYINNN